MKTILIILLVVVAWLYYMIYKFFWWSKIRLDEGLDSWKLWWILIAILLLYLVCRCGG